MAKKLNHDKFYAGIRRIQKEGVEQVAKILNTHIIK